MNGKRLLLVVVAILVLVAGLWAGLVVVSGDPSPAVQVAAQEPGSDPVPVGNVPAGQAGEGEPDGATATQGGEPSDTWFSSDPPPDGMSLEGLSPPDRPATLSDLDDPEAADPQATWARLRTAGSALKPRESSVEWYGVPAAAGCIYASSGSASAIFNVPVYLPQGAEANYLRMYYNDTAAATNCTAWFTVYDDHGNVHEEWMIASIGDSGAGNAVTEEFAHTIDYSLYSYVINWRPNELGTDMQVCGFLVYYTPLPGATYLPSVLSDAP